MLNDRLDRIESQLRGVAIQTPDNQTQMPVSPEETGAAVQTLPTDVASRLQVRVLQLERLVETLTGQVEQSQFEVMQMRAQLQQLSNDVSYRLAVLEQAAGVSSAVAAPPPTTSPGAMTGTELSAIPDAAVPGVGQPPIQAPPPARTMVGGQSPQAFAQPQTPAAQALTAPSQASRPAPTFDSAGRVAPDLSMPMSSPVQPQPQIAVPVPAAPPPSTAMASGTEVSPQSLSPEPTPAGTQLLAPGEALTAPVQSGPVNQGNTFGVVRTDESGNVLPPSADALAQPAQPMVQQPAAPVPPRIAAAPSPGPVAAAQIGTAPSPLDVMTALPDGTPQEQYDYAFNILRQADYVRAETALRMFLEANPTDTLAGNAQYWLGETFYVRGDFEQAAVEFLSGYQTFPNSNKAPDNLLKLGLSMARLGQTDGACTALSRLATEYPEANDTIRRRAQTERARLSCT